jgi:hypothetical protein
VQQILKKTLFLPHVLSLPLQNRVMRPRSMILVSSSSSGGCGCGCFKAFLVSFPLVRQNLMLLSKFLFLVHVALICNGTSQCLRPKTKCTATYFSLVLSSRPFHLADSVFVTSALPRSAGHTKSFGKLCRRREQQAT